MLVNQFQSLVFNCAGNAQIGYQCMYASDLAPAGKIRGAAILEAFNYHTGLESQWVGIMIEIIMGYRVVGYLVLVIKKT